MVTIEETVGEAGITAMVTEFKIAEYNKSFASIFLIPVNRKAVSLFRLL